MSTGSGRVSPAWSEEEAEHLTVRNHEHRFYYAVDVSVDVAEVCSPPRIIAESNKMFLRAGEATGLTTGWDCSQPEDRERPHRGSVCHALVGIYC